MTSSSPLPFTPPLGTRSASRQDSFANAHPIPVEEDKPEGERGTYLHPEAWGQPKERGLDFQRDAQLPREPAAENRP